MKKALILVAFACAPVMAADWKGNAIVLTEKEMQQCVEGGGCAVITRAMVAEMQAALQFLLAEREAQAKTCRKGASI